MNILDTPKGENNPVEEVSRQECLEFLKKLCVKAGVPACLCGRARRQAGTYRLPTEAEWEYACRAGTTTRFYSGDADSALDKVGWHEDNGGKTTHPVGGKEPNGWGLYDMHGNVWEWCSDRTGGYTARAATDPSGPRSGSVGVLRGGSWNYVARFCRSANRAASEVGARDYDFGFRIAMTMP